jgi:hypothetical protein
MSSIRELLKGGRVKGGIIRAHLDWLRQNHGDESVRDVLSVLRPEIASEIREALASSWCRFESVVLLDRAIAAKYGAATIRELGRFSARQNLSTTYRAFQRSDIHEFFEKSAALHAQFQDFGAEDYVRTGAQSGRMTHRAYTSFSPTYCESACGYYEEAMTIHGATSVSADHPLCIGLGAKECVFDLQWS